MTKSVLKYFDKKLLSYILLVLVTGTVFSLFSRVGTILIVFATILWNKYLYKGKLLALFIGIIFLVQYSLVWGGNLGFIILPVNLLQ